MHCMCKMLRHRTRICRAPAATWPSSLNASQEARSERRPCFQKKERANDAAPTATSDSASARPAGVAIMAGGVQRRCGNARVVVGVWPKRDRESRTRCTVLFALSQLWVAFEFGVVRLFCTSNPRSTLTPCNHSVAMVAEPCAISSK